jgi:cytidylate kinase
MIVTISGNLGSGKSTVADALAEKFHLKRYSAGDFMRDMAEERGLTLLELSKLAEADPAVDKEIDERNKTLAEKEKDFVIDSRLAWYFIPGSLKIYLKCDVNESAKRIFKRKQKGDSDNVSLEATTENILRREKSEVERYKNYYGIDLHDESNYDLVIDTTNYKKEEVIKKVIDWVEKHKL